MWPRVLICSPIHDSKEFVLDHWLDHISKLTYPNAEFLIVSNSKVKAFNKRIKKRCNELGFMFTQAEQDNPSIHKKLAGCYNVMRSHALRRNIEFMCTIECDNFPPINGVERLIEASINEDAPVVITPYITNEKYDRFQIILITTRDELGGYGVDRLMTTSEAFNFIDGTVKDVFGGGMGFAVIRSDIFHGTKFKGDNNIFQDSHFFVECYDRQIRVMMDTGMMVDHINHEYFLQNN